MALQATVRRLKLQLSDVDRSVYEALDLRLAQHPSENDLFLVTRALAYALSYEEGIAFGHGLSHAEEPALSIKELDGRLKAWIEVGTPSAERLHRASKLAPQVVIYTQHDPELIRREAAKTPIYRADEIVLYAPAPPLLRALAERVDRAMSWDVSRSGGHLYVTTGGETFEGELTQWSLGP